ncbi:MAG TPA: hypothetical protein VF553_03030 [Pyrinomonadaceae bacterium]
MIEPERTGSDAERPEATTSGVGDVETAGETTAADTIGGPANTTPVGADTMAKVDGTGDSAASLDERNGR